MKNIDHRTSEELNWRGAGLMPRPQAPAWRVVSLPDPRGSEYGTVHEIRDGNGKLMATCEEKEIADAIAARAALSKAEGRA